MEIDYGNPLANELLNYLRYNNVNDNIISQITAILDHQKYAVKEEILKILRQNHVNKIIILNVEDIIYKHRF